MSEYMVWYGNGDDINAGWLIEAPTARDAACEFVKVKTWQAADVHVRALGEETIYDDREMFEP